MPDQIPFALPDLGEREIEAVVAVLRSKWLTSGAECRSFEEEFGSATQAQHAVAVNSCTAALHLSLEALGVGDGDVVFVPPYTFAATAEVVRYVGAHPFFVDVDPVTANLDPAQLRQALESAERFGTPKAVIPVHFAGVPCDMDEIWAIARDNKLAVVEDAAHAFPSSYRGRPVGWIPEDVVGTACFSFYATKTITTGEGGMVTTNSAVLADRMRVMSLHGLSRQAWNRYSGGTWKYEVVAPGYKYNLTDIAAALGRVQLDRASEMRDRRAAIAQQYTEALEGLGLFECPRDLPSMGESSWHLYVLRILKGGEKERDALIDSLKVDGVGVSMHFIPLHLHTYYRDTYGYKPEDFPISLDIYARSLSLPLYSGMGDEQVERVIEAVVMNGRRVLA